jgi:hypothetical protein
MKKYLFLLLGCLFATATFAQNASLVLKADKVQGIILTLNGNSINSTLAPEVRAEKLTGATQKASLEVKTAAGTTVYDIVSLSTEEGYTYYYNVGVDANNKIFIRLFDKTASGASPAPVAAAPSAAPAPAPAQTSTQASSSTTVTTTTTTTAPAPTTGAKIKNFFNNLGQGKPATVATDNNGNRVSINPSAVYGAPQGNPNAGQNYGSYGQPAGGANNAAAEEPANDDPEPNTVVNCYAMNFLDFEDLIKSMKAQTWDKDKKMVLTQAKACYNLEQIGQLMDLFTYETDKLWVAKYGYTRSSKLYDRPKYYTLNDKLTYSSSKTELDAYIKRIGQ